MGLFDFWRENLFLIQMSAHIHIAAKRAFQLGFFAHGNGMGAGEKKLVPLSSSKRLFYPDRKDLCQKCSGFLGGACGYPVYSRIIQYDNFRTGQTTGFQKVLVPLTFFAGGVFKILSGILRTFKFVCINLKFVIFSGESYWFIVISSGLSSMMLGKSWMSANM